MFFYWPFQPMKKTNPVVTNTRKVEKMKIEQVEKKIFLKPNLTKFKCLDWLIQKQLAK